jgi:hypothetical protein
MGYTPTHDYAPSGEQQATGLTDLFQITYLFSILKINPRINPEPRTVFWRGAMPAGALRWLNYRQRPLILQRSI